MCTLAARYERCKARAACDNHYKIEAFARCLKYLKILLCQINNFLFIKGPIAMYNHTLLIRAGIKIQILNDFFLI